MSMDWKDMMKTVVGSLNFAKQMLTSFAKDANYILYCWSKTTNVWSFEKGVDSFYPSVLFDKNYHQAGIV